MNKMCVVNYVEYISPAVHEPQVGGPVLNSLARERNS